MSRAGQLYILLILSLLLANVIYLTIGYMQYDTDTNVAPHLPVKLNMIKLSLCFEINSLMDTSPHGFSFDSEPIKERNLTFGQIFEKMPKAESTLESCKYRDFDLNILVEEPDGEKCNQLFQVIRYRMQGFMCYRFDFKSVREYSYHAIVNSLYQQRELFYLNISQPLSEQVAMYPFLHFDDLPDDERSFSQPAHKDSDSTFQLSYGFYESYRLPSPYETHCKDMSTISCYQKCLDDSYKDLGFSPDSGLVVENASGVSLRPTPVDFDIYPKRAICHDRCKFDACNQKFVVTSVRKTENKNEKLLFIIETVNRLIVKIVYMASFSLLDYVTQVGSVVAIWTGVSVITLCKLVESRDQLTLRRLYFKIKSYWIIVRIVLSLRPMDKEQIGKDELSFQRIKLRSKIKKMSIASVLVKLAILPILGWQLFNVAENYFQYSTTAKFNYDMNPKVFIPTLVVCIDYEDLFRGNLLQVTEENYHQFYLDQVTKSNLTLKELFEQSPGSGLMDGCFTRDWKSRFKQFHFHNGSICTEYFSVKKFVSNRKLCYRFVPQSLGVGYYQSDIKLLPTNPGIIYSIILGPKIPFPHKLYMMTQFGSDLPLTSIEYSVFVYEGESKHMVILSNRLYAMQLMPPPYDTSCNPVRGDKSCFERCISQSLEKFNRISYASTEERNLTLRFLSYSDLLNGSMNVIWTQTITKCKKNCWRAKCSYNFTLTSIEGFVPVEYNKIFAVDLPSHPTVELTALSLLSFYGFMYQILCCVSFWWGLSFLDFEPTSAEAKSQMKIQFHLTQMYLTIDKVIDKLFPSRWSPVEKLHLMNWRKAIELTIYLLSILSCIYHLVDQMKIYLTYSSFIDVYEMLDTRTDSGLIIGLDTAELISRKYPSNIEDPTVAKSNFFNRTVASLFEDTPKGDQLIQHCGHWGLAERRQNISNTANISDRIFFDTKNKSVCDEIYEIQKVVIQSYMCYIIRPRNYSLWSRVQMKHALNQQTTLLKVAINSSLLTQRFTVMATFAKYVPFSSSAWAPNLIQDPQYDRYMVSYIRYIQSLLPSPKTNDGFTPFLFDRCINNCVNKNLAKSNLTLSQRFPKPSDFRFVTYFDRRRGNLSKIINENQNRCEYKCLHFNDYIMVERSGNIEIFLPTVEARKTKEGKKSDFISFYLKSTSHPILSITFKLKISLFEQIINLGSIVGLWFGFSAMSLAKIGSIKDKQLSFHDLSSLEQRIRRLKDHYNMW